MFNHHTFTPHGQASQTHLAILESQQIPVTPPTTSTLAMRHAESEIFAFHRPLIAEIFIVAKLLRHAAQTTFDQDAPDDVADATYIYPFDQISDLVGADVARLALGLCGCTPRNYRGSDTVWADGKLGGVPEIMVRLDTVEGLLNGLVIDHE